MRQPETDRARRWPAAILALAAVAAAALLLQGVSLAHLLDPWFQTRAAGLVALVLLWASVCLGLLQSAGLLKGLSAAAANVDLHDFVSLAALYATVYHFLILLWDRYVGFRLSELLVPFASHYQAGLLGLGTLAFYLALVATVTTYLRGRLSPRLWRTIHLTSLTGFLFAWLHGVWAGTDSALPSVVFLYTFTGLSVALLTAYRLIKGVQDVARAAGRR